ncbi:MAG: hypothetical protein CVU49_09765 [Candidatus Cloacimonetes bacterium HGW-Cloacimonetes-2]|nr:MAG: hypothetical protein CVU49_09765 [Candidatus Cloacimonetes bacterium HGW-Cloacimonetes-2]
MKSYILILLILAASIGLMAQYALPITEYDYTVPENNVSPIVMGMGGLNITSSVDAFGAYHNPALLAESEITSLSTSFRLAKQRDLTFWQAMQISNTLREKQFQYFALSAKQFAFTYHPAASVHLNEWNATGDSLRYYDYKLDKVQLSLAGTDSKYPALKMGLSLKYYSGRLVYLKEHKLGVNLVRDVFIDDKVKGFGTDIGLTVNSGDFTWGASVYDLFSRLYWENYPSEPVQRRMALGMEYKSGGAKLLGGLQYKVAKDPETSFHFGLDYDWNWQSSGLWGEGTADQGFAIRLGMFSNDFYGTRNINYTVGTGYNYNLLRFDVSMTNRGMVLKDSDFLFAVGIGLK